MASGCFRGRVLVVDLTAGRVEVQPLPEHVARQYLGGAALGLWWLLRQMPAGVNPLGPANQLVFASGLLGGVPVSGTSRFNISAKSPLTGGLAEAQASGWWAPELRRAGYDALVVQGVAPRPVYLWIHGDQVELREASHLWGLETGPAQEAIRDEVGDPRARVACIGPAGERGVRYACILNELRHVNGRTGLGAVMGSKRLKAVAVRGEGTLPLHDPQKVRDLARSAAERIPREPGSFHDLGTSRGVVPLSLSGMLPTRNFQTSAFEGAGRLSGERLRDTYLVGRGTCWACAVACKREVRIDEGPYRVDPMYGGPEYETIAALGSCCGVDDLAAVCKAHELCQRLGLDTISTGVTIAFAMECYERGLIGPEQTGGLDLRFGNAEAMVALVEQIGRREGFGHLLGEGVARLAHRLGPEAEAFAMHARGQEFPMHEPRARASLALAFSLSPTGAEHVEAPHDVQLEKVTDSFETFRLLGVHETMPADELSQRKARAFHRLQRLWGLFNSLGMCIFCAQPLGPLTLPELVDLVHASTGWDLSLEDLLRVKDRHTALSRLFNLREGMTRADDVLPRRMFQPIGSGPREGHRLLPEEFRQAVQTYYQEAGWDEEGIPKEETLRALDLHWALPILAAVKRKR
ncbi:MAG: aldehyde ferredoxin oxidoreductase family protein [Anaerolineae bacterium]